MMNYEVEMEQWPYKGTGKKLLEQGFGTFFHWYPKKVRMALWEYDVWDCLWNENSQITYVQTWAEARNDMHLYPFTSLDELADYLIKEEGYSYSDLVLLGYDSVNKIDPLDAIWVWGDDGVLHSYTGWIDYLEDFKDFGEWDDFIRWATNPYGNNALEALKTALKAVEIGVHLDYIEMLGDYFGPFLDKLTGDKRDWFIRRIKLVYQVGDEDAERILLGGEAL
nr:MAG TPA: hypothetical protein [Caudoviricetes sp.]